MKTFHNKNVLVVSATSALAGEIMKEVKSEGGNLFLVARNEKKLLSEREEFIDNNYFIADVTKRKEVLSSIIAAEEYFGDKFDYVFLCQGYIRVKQIRELTVNSIEKSNNVNYMSCVYYVMEMLSRKSITVGSHVIFISSVSSICMTPEAHSYISSKKSLECFADELLYELRPRGIDITVAKPGFFKSKFVNGNNFLPFLKESNYVAKKIIKSVKKRKAYVVFPNFMKLLLSSLSIFKLLFPNIFFWFSTYWYNSSRKKLALGPADMDVKKENQFADKFGWKRLVFGIFPGFVGKRLFNIKNERRKPI